MPEAEEPPAAAAEGTTSEEAPAAKEQEETKEDEGGDDKGEGGGDAGGDADTAGGGEDADAAEGEDGGEEGDVEEEEEEVEPDFEREIAVEITEPCEKWPPKGFIGCDLLDSTLGRHAMKWGEEMGETREWKLVPKENIFAEIAKMGAGSDFAGNQKELKKHKGDMLLFLKAPENDDDVNWVICGTNAIFEKYNTLIQETIGKMKAEIEAAKAKKNSKKSAGGGEGDDKDMDDEEEEEEDDAEEDLVDFEEKVYIPNPDAWVDSGSQEELERVQVKNQRPLLGLYIAQQRKKFGGKATFTDWQMDKIPEYHRQAIAGYEKKTMECEAGFQAGGYHTFEDKCTQTENWRVKLNKITQYEPIELSEEERKSEMETIGFQEFITNVSASVEGELQKNETVDLFKNEFNEFEGDEGTVGNRAENSLKEIHSFTDLKHSKDKIISAVDWHPTRTGLVAFSATNNLTFEKWVEMSGTCLTSCILMWNFKGASADLLRPQLILDVPGDVTCFEINPDNPDFVVAGLNTGQVMFWDIAEHRVNTKKAAAIRLAAKTGKSVEQVQTRINGDEGKKEATEGGEEEEEHDSDDVGDDGLHVRPSLTSDIDRSHSSGVTGLMWLPRTFEVNKKGSLKIKDDQQMSHQFCTLGGDGTLYFWDVRPNRFKNPMQLAKEEQEGLREPRWETVAQVVLGRADGPGTMNAVKMMHIDKSHLKAVTEDGEVVDISWEGPDDDKNKNNTVTNIISNAHVRCCTGIVNSPHFDDIFLTIGDNTFSIWKVGMPTPILKSSFSDAYLSCGGWSPSRPGLLIMARRDGTLDVWDLLDQAHKPVVNFPVGSDPLTSLKFWQSKSGKTQYIGVGDAAGKLHVIEVPRSMRRPIPNEEEMMKYFYDREIKHCEYWGERREIRNKEKAGETEGGDESVEVKLTDAEMAEQAKVLKQKEDKYQGMLKEFKNKLLQ